MNWTTIARDGNYETQVDEYEGIRVRCDSALGRFECGEILWDWSPFWWWSESSGRFEKYVMTAIKLMHANAQFDIDSRKRLEENIVRARQAIHEMGDNSNPEPPDPVVATCEHKDIGYRIGEREAHCRTCGTSLPPMDG